MERFRDGVWPVMLTPLQEDGRLDMAGLEALVAWYIAQGCDGLFAVCQSSEMFFLSLEERVALARAAVRWSAGRVPVVVSGHISQSMQDQARELCAMADCGADAVVLVSNRLVSSPEDNDAVLIANLRALLRALPSDMPLGFYECPYPFKRLLSPQVLRFCLDSGRFSFLKDTSCDMNALREKLCVLRGSKMKLYNANTATLLESLRAGAHGYTGVMANFHPALYGWLIRHWQAQPGEAEMLQSVLSMCALIELKHYPACAKRYLRRAHGLPIRDATRREPQPPIPCDEDAELAQLARLSAHLCARLSQHEHCATPVAQS